jgi:hypothetical protein
MVMVMVLLKVASQRMMSDDFEGKATYYSGWLRYLRASMQQNIGPCPLGLILDLVFDIIVRLLLARKAGKNTRLMRPKRYARN